MNDTDNTIYSHGKLFISIVERRHGENLVSQTKRSGARGGTILRGRGTATSALLEMLGLGDTEKDVVFTLATDDVAPAIHDMLRASQTQGRKHAGISMKIDVKRILRHILPTELADSDPSTQRSASMNNHIGQILITFILNKGYADDAMAAARKAGATGGTILNGRGTGKEEDVKFFGISLVPEKEILLILVEASQADAILEAVKKVPCLSEPGAGIAYSLEVEDSIQLGKTEA